MTALNKQALREAAEKATKGEWRAFTGAGGTCSIHTAGDERLGDVVDWPGFDGKRNAKANAKFIAAANPVTVLLLLDELEAAEKRIAEQSDYFSALVAAARKSADKAMRKYPQPNYVLLKVAEEAGEVVRAGVHYAENRMTWDEVEGEIVQLLAMLIRLVTEGDQINGVTPPQSVRAAGIGVKGD